MKNILLVILLLLFTDACVDRLEFDAGEQGEAILVVDGLITDQPGPYTVKLLRSSNVDDILNLAAPFAAQSVTLSDDAGNSEALKNLGAGLWETSPEGIQGQVGRSYSLRIVASDGTIYESAPDRMRPVEAIDSVYFQWESFLPIGSPAENGFRIFMDTKGVEGEENFLRWKFVGTYQVLTFPERRRFNNANCINPGFPDPSPCSGVVWQGQFGGAGFLRTVGECSCCFCWVSDFEDKPRLADNQIVTDGSFRKVEMGFVPFDAFRFHFGKYMVKVEQMSLSREAFDFWEVIKDQKEGINSLFQPAFGKVKTNIFSTNSDKEATGIFYASSVKRKILFITGADAPIPVPEFDIIPPETNCVLWQPCDRIFPNSSTTPPPEWN